MLTLTDVLNALTSYRPALSHVEIGEAAIDSRQAGAGSLFIAIPGERVDGHNYIHQAFERGALAALVERDMPGEFFTLDLRQGWPLNAPAELPLPLCLRVENTVTALQQIAAFWRSKLPGLRVVGITGSVGKSTTKEVAAGVLAQRYHTLKSHANLNNEIGLPLNILKLTPEHEFAVLEMGFYVPGEIAQLCDIARPEIGALTLIGTVHAARAGTQEMIAQGKGELVEALPGDGVAILNYDDPFIRPMKARTRARVFYYGLTPEADLWASDVQTLGLDGVRFTLNTRETHRAIHTPLPGRHSVQTALCAAAVGLAAGLTWDEITRGLQENPPQLRLLTRRLSNGALVIDDTYNAAPESTLAALDLLHEVPGRRIAVLGDMLELGMYEREGHQKVGQRAARVADTLITLGVRAHLIAESARQAGMNPAVIREYEDIAPIVDWLKKNLTAQDVALVKGSRGLQMERIIAALETTP